MSEPCGGAKRDIGILISPPIINPPCDCYKDVLFPIGSLLGVFKNIARKIFAKQLLAFQLGLLRTPLVQAIQKRAYASNILNGINDKINNLSTELSQIGNKLKKQLEVLTASTANLNTLNEKLNSKLKKTRQIVENMTTLLQGVASQALEFDKRTGAITINYSNVPIFIRTQLDSLLSQYNTSRAELANLSNQVQEATLELELIDNAVKYLSAKYESLVYEIGGIRGPAIQIGDYTIPSGTLVNQRSSVEDLVQQLKYDEDRIYGIIKSGRDAISSNNSTTMLIMVDIISNNFSAIAAQAADYLLDLLSTLSTIEKVNCMESSMLNEETCDCTECPPDKVLCGGPDSGLQSILPSLPGIRSGSEKNTCVDRCCPGLQLISNNVGNCYCICEDSSQTIKPCNSADCVAKVTCASPPPDSSELGLFGSSKYIWDADECDWVCKDNPCDHSCCDEDEDCCGTECCPNDQNCCEGVCCASGEICCGGVCCSGDCEEDTCCATGLSLSHLYDNSIIP